ncbi:agamous-like MADS-box protein AGL62 [Syzygium oleosum]|uniref:agamous-like MADS-box protein AGL62 n=1 Tax=Syzygium oleosum TaxID=219896 RepID=UPI0011D29E30|nr:agamous-like MADS-box protein AGL62 [Syzygium oleosum]
MARMTRGRQRIQMAKMDNESNLQVTFSKRRSGLFKKASELSTLCGADVALIVFSPGEKAFSFGHPNVDTVLDRFLNGNELPQQTPGTAQLIEAHRNATICELNMQLTDVLGQLEMEKKRGEELKKSLRANQEKHWWEKPIDELSVPQLEQLRVSLFELRKNVGKETEQMVIQATNGQPFFGASSSHGPAIPFQAQNGISAPVMPPNPLPYNFGYGSGYF